jgi:type I restriction enzyme, S subunit
MSFLQYESFQDSGVDWIGKIPQHWVTCALKRLVSLRSGDSITADDINETGAFPVYGGNGLRGYTAAHTHDGQHVLIGRQGALCGNINYAAGKFWASEHAVVVTPNRRMEVRWLGELLRAMDLNQYSVSAAQPGLSVEAISNLQIPVPPLPEQTVIAAFFDRETTKIDVLVEEQQRLIELLKEKRQAVISHAVTKGLDPDAPMKESNVEWLGEVPEHWEISRLRRVISAPLGNGIFKKKDEFGRGTPLINVFDIYTNDFKVRLGTLDRVECTTSEIATYCVQPGDLFFVRSSLKLEGIAAVAVADNWPEAVVFECHLVRVRPVAAVLHPRYASYLLNSDFFRAILISKAKTTTMTTVDQDAISSTHMLIPPPLEQSTIASFLDRETAKIDALVTEVEAAIALLQERRIALISAVVTGKIDVRGPFEASAPISDVVAA